MKKKNTHALIAVLIGIIAAQYFFNKHPISNTIKVTETKASITGSTVQQPIKTVSEPSEGPASIKRQPIVYEQGESQNKKNVIDSLGTQPEPKLRQPRLIELTLDEQTISNLEKNINDLSVKVNMRREDRGWRVDFVAPDNLMTTTGIQNDDLVLYELIETAKANLRNRSLVTRLEIIFSTLER